LIQDWLIIGDQSVTWFVQIGASWHDKSSNNKMTAQLYFILILCFESRFFRLITSLMSVSDDFLYLCELLFVELLDMVAILKINFYFVWRLRTGPSYFILSLLLFQREYFNTVNQLFNKWKLHNPTVATRYQKLPSMVHRATQNFLYHLFSNFIAMSYPLESLIRNLDLFIVHFTAYPKKYKKI
jgi:hypothetical protein